MVEVVSRARLGVLASHPIQYYAPWYRALAREADLTVYYCHRITAQDQAVAGFGVPFHWDVPLLEGYQHVFLVNRARQASVMRFWGCHTPEIGSHIRQQRYDAFIVHGWNLWSFWQALIACWRTKTPILIRGDSHLDTRRRGLWRLLKEPIYRWFVPRFDGYLIVGERARRYLLHYGADRRRMFFSPHAVDNDYFRRGAERLRPRREELRKAWQVPVSGTVFLFAGKFIPSKRPEDFARAIGEAARHEAGITGLMVGDGPLRSRLEELARAHDWPVRFTGFLNQSQMPEAYACSDALVVTSESETWGLVVNEAMSSGLPVIVNDQVGCSDDLVDAATGKTYCCGDVPELAEHLVRLAREPEHRRALGEAASQHVDKYSITRAVQGVLETVRHVAAPRSLYLPTRSAHDG